jgi:hypothetical protein
VTTLGPTSPRPFRDRVAPRPFRDRAAPRPFRDRAAPRPFRDDWARTHRRDHAYGEARAWATHRATVLQAEWRRARTRTGGALLVVLGLVVALAAGPLSAGGVLGLALAALGTWRWTLGSRARHPRPTRPARLPLPVVLPDASRRSVAAPRLADAAAARDRVHAVLPLLRRRDPDAVPRVAATVHGCTRLVGDLARAVLTLERTGPHAGAPTLGPLLAELDRAVAALRSLDASVARVVTDDHAPGAGSPWDGGVASLEAELAGVTAFLAARRPA